MEQSVKHVEAIAAFAGATLARRQHPNAIVKFETDASGAIRILHLADGRSGPAPDLDIIRRLYRHGREGGGFPPGPLYANATYLAYWKSTPTGRMWAYRLAGS